MGTLNSSPSVGELALEDRSALHHVAELSTGLVDVSEVEYPQLRLERVVLVDVWTKGGAPTIRPAWPNSCPWLRPPVRRSSKV